MPTFDPAESLESLEGEIDRWRNYLRRRRAIRSPDVAELEDHLRDQIVTLIQGGLAPDEAFLIAVKRLGDLDSLSMEFAREHADRLWKQLVVPRFDDAAHQSGGRTDAVVAFLVAAAAALAVKVPSLFGIEVKTEPGFYAGNFSLFVLPFLTGYFAWKRRLGGRTVLWLLLGFAVAAVLANIYPLVPEGQTEALTALHLPMVLWLLVGMAYAGHRWGQVAGRMDFIRFTGELLIYFVLIGLGGVVLTASMAAIFESLGIDMEPFFESWLLPPGAAGAVVVAAWLVEAKQDVIENMAPVLARLFTPLFTAVMLVFLGTVLWTGRGVSIERDVLITFDLLLVVVLGLLLYSISARDPASPPGLFDVLQVVLVVSALLVDVVALEAIAGRITEFGFTPNRIAALGENVILLVNLAWSAVLYGRFLGGRGPFSALERWQTGYLPVYAAWAALVVIVFPPVFGYI